MYVVFAGTLDTFIIFIAAGYSEFTSMYLTSTCIEWLNTCVTPPKYASRYISSTS